MRTDSIEVNIEAEEPGMFSDLPAPEPATKAVLVDLTKDQVSLADGSSVYICTFPVRVHDFLSSRTLFLVSGPCIVWVRFDGGFITSPLFRNLDLKKVAAKSHTKYNRRRHIPFFWFLIFVYAVLSRRSPVRFFKFRFSFLPSNAMSHRFPFAQ